MAKSANKSRPKSAPAPFAPKLNGKFIYPDGSRYEGEYKEHDPNISAVARCGTGTFTCATSGCVYSGSWESDRMEGPGEIVYPSGARYEGQWQNGKYHGNGTYIWANGSRFEGEFREGQMQGRGKFTDISGQGWIGAIENGQGQAMIPLVI
ncbi:hypothetical protein HDU85_006338 [Gaertneriomyces sp. JEL0708]|nr:hypothetical protein HDU85_006338 [Gaertneriomyces sp. JEL0708]